MAPTLALILCIAFVLFLMRGEWQTARNNSLALLIPTVWIMISASRPLATWSIAPGDVVRGNDAGSVLDRWVLAALAGAAIIVLARRRADWLGKLRQHKWLLAVLAYMFLSAFWSEITLIALKRWTREVIVVLMALVIASEANPRQALASVLRRCAYVLLPFSLVMIKYYPALGRQYGRWSGLETWTGVTLQKNQLGRLCAICAFVMLSALYTRWRNHSSDGASKQKWADISILLLAIYLLIGSKSSTSMVTFVIGMAVYAGLHWFRKKRFKVSKVALTAFALFLIAYGASGPFLGGLNVAGFSSSLGRNETLTGRTEVWAALLPAFEKQPFFGYGFGSFWTDARRELYDIPTAHNGYLDILLELGAVGLAFYTIWLLSCARQLHRCLGSDYEWASIGITFLLMGLVYNSTESSLNSLAESMTAVLVLSLIVVTGKPKNISLRSEMLPIAVAAQMRWSR